MKLVYSFLVLLCLATSQCSWCQLIAVEPPSSTAVANNGSVTLRCTTSSPPPPPEAVSGQERRVVTWIREGEGELHNTSHVSVTGGQLTIEPFHSASHHGRYSCLIEGESGAVQSCPTTIAHAKIEFNFTREPQDTVAPLLSIAVLMCHAPFSVPTATVAWKHNGSFIDFDSDARRSLIASGNMYIVNTQYSDSGTYRCIATNQITAAKRRSRIASLSIVGIPDPYPDSDITPPVFTIAPGNVTVVRGEGVRLECAAVGTPPPDIGWLHVSAKTFPHHWTVGSNGVLSTAAVKEEDAGVWKCNANNTGGLVHHYFHIVVKAPPGLSLQPPGQSTQVVTVGDSLSLSCAVTAADLVTVEWYRDAVSIAVMQDVGGMATLNHTLSRVDQSDSGIYQCKAYNDLLCMHDELVVMVTEPDDGDMAPGSVPSPSPSPSPSHAPFTSSEDPVIVPTSTSPPSHPHTSTQLLGGATVSASPVPPSSSPLPSPSTPPPDPTVTVMPAFVFLKAGTMATLTCVVHTSGRRPVEVHWSSEERVLENEAELIIIGDSTIISKLTVHTPGHYDCIVYIENINYFENVPVIVEAADVVVTLQDRAPLLTEGDTALLECQVEGAGLDATVTWSLATKKEEGLPPNARVQTQFSEDVVEYDSQLTLAPLSPEHGGVWFCTVETDEGRTHVSGQFNLTVRAALPSTPPLNVTVTPSTHGNEFGVLVSWHPPHSNSKIQGYKLSIETARPGVPAIAQTTTNQTQVFLALDPFQSHTVRLWAYTLAGDGPVLSTSLPPLITTVPPTTGTSEATPTTATPPELRCEALNSSAIRLALPEEFLQSADKGVELRYGCRLLGGHVIRRTVPMPIDGFTLSQLLPSCDYDITVTVATATELVCQTSTTDGQLDIDAMATRHPNKTVVVSWRLPPELQRLQVTEEIRIGEGEWLPADHAPRIRSELEEGYLVTLRFSYRQWRGSVALPILPLSTEEGAAGSVSTSPGELGIIYGVVLGLLLVLCTALLLVILALKYKQLARREVDKLTNHRETQGIKRESQERSSIKSLQKISSPVRNGHAQEANGHAHNGNIYHAPSTDV